MSNNLSDKELVMRYQAGDVSCFQILVDRYQNKVYSYIMMLVRDRQLADDLFQDTFLKIIRTIKGGAYKEEGKFIQFAMRIAHNLIIDYFRKEKRLPMVDPTKEDYDMLANARMKDPSVEERIITEQIYDDLRKMINRLPDEQREVLNLRFYSDMSYKEIADVTNVSINTALGRMRYALINLRKIAEEKKLTLTI
ncbi:MAG: sigma-70 family RNA polymerase sigma factor [Candidatus Limimorpha sp.]|nr:sigma-70 family RNA polymerase sigma factor [Bacteroidales bacterium]MCI7376605.1 sigma-70 family RNA polymerase sigma factor [Bacteroidales bacterium]MDD5978552.1 sigma-70 family RNA polymerase sigma factor [Bacteroidales bacterium]MDD7276412.1 sigma-70 family RNA polymerase sigma factor [Bacteroidales bacterium]MDY6074358.1 sigma-70 family RNA polymerase sigma factor [Bacteroidales bacterium]